LYGITPGTEHTDGRLDGDHGHPVETVKEPAGASAMTSEAVR
jgi:hypothetical protein